MFARAMVPGLLVQITPIALIAVLAITKEVAAEPDPQPVHHTLHRNHPAPLEQRACQPREDQWIVRMMDNPMIPRGMKTELAGGVTQ
jgi:hypothetical protein